jgi:hypothetical protein
MRPSLVLGTWSTENGSKTNALFLIISTKNLGHSSGLTIAETSKSDPRQLISLPAGFDAEQRIRRAPADDSCCKRNNSEICPRGFRPYKG